MGLWHNLPGLEAADDLRFIMSIGAALGGENGRDHIQRLADIAWNHDPKVAETIKLSALAADAHRGIMAPMPQTTEKSHG